MQDYSKLWPGGNVVVGGGRFGQIALERLPGKIALAVEPSPSRELAQYGAPVWAEEGIIATLRMLSDSHPPEYIIPTLPVHLLAEWLRAALPKMQPKRIELLLDIPPSLQVNIHCSDNVLYLSVADFTCPDNCPEPANICTVTGEPRGAPLYERIMLLSKVGYRIGIIKSRQLAPGVGGLLVQDMLKLRDEIAQKPGVWVIATACKCHGVLELINFRVPKGVTRQ